MDELLMAILRIEAQVGRRWRSFVVTILCFFVANGAMKSYAGQMNRTGDSKLRLIVTPQSIVVKKGQPILFDIRIVNEGQKTIKLLGDFTPYPAAFQSKLPLQVTVTDQKSKAVDYTGVIYRLGVVSYFHHLGPDYYLGARKVDISRYFAFKCPGEYKVSFRYALNLSRTDVDPSIKDWWNGSSNVIICKVKILEK